MAGIRASSAHLSLTSLIILYGMTVVALYYSSSTIVFQVNTGVSYCLDYIEDIYDCDPLCPCFNP